jgi:hypothetical protein
MLYLIYKTIYDSNGNILHIELVEADYNETSAASFQKLCNLQRPHDMRDRIEYSYMPIKLVA